VGSRPGHDAMHAHSSWRPTGRHAVRVGVWEGRGANGAGQLALATLQRQADAAGRRGAGGGREQGA
jgi:hypothetical protein